jgi:acetyl esterase/lipase
VQAAVRWLRAQAGKYPLDPKRIGAVGFSAGGSLACLLGLLSPRHGLEGGGDHAKQSSRVQAVVSYFAPTDLECWHTQCVKGEVPRFQGFFIRRGLEKWLGGPPDEVAERYHKASPITYASRDGAPLLLIHGTADKVVPVSHAQSLAKKIKEVDGLVELLLVKQAPHDFDELDTPAAREAAAATRAFLDTHLKRAAGKR